MKKTFLLLCFLAGISAAFAQDDRYRGDKNNGGGFVPGRDDRQTVYNNLPVRDGRRNVPYVDVRQRDEEIASVTADYNRRIDAVRFDRFLRGREKAREIRRLQAEKEQAVRAIGERYERMKADRNRW